MECPNFLSKPILPGHTIVTCTMNRNDNLLKAVDSWIKLPIQEIIIVDWSSDQSTNNILRSNGLLDKRIIVVEVKSEQFWNLTQAFNLGFKFVNYSHIIKADADVLISPNFFELNTLIDNSFLRGNWKAAKDKEQVHLNGFFYIKTSDLQKVNGFNEHIRNYGYDDADLYERLKFKGLDCDHIEPDSLLHLFHDDSSRGNCLSPDLKFMHYKLRSNLSFLILYNRYLSMLMPSWTIKSIPQVFEIIYETDNYYRVQKVQEDKDTLFLSIRKDAYKYALLKYLSWTHGNKVYDYSPSKINAVLDSL